MTKHQAVTITKEEAVADISKVAISVLKDSVEDLVNGQSDVTMFEHFHNLKELPAKEIGDMWCELCSESFLQEHKGVTDVLLLEEITANGTPIKSWLASK